MRVETLRKVIAFERQAERTAAVAQVLRGATVPERAVGSTRPSPPHEPAFSRERRGGRRVQDGSCCHLIQDGYVLFSSNAYQPAESLPALSQHDLHIVA